MTTVAVVAGILVALALIGVGLDRLGLWAERKGWIFYRAKRGKGAVNLGFLDQIYQPAMEHVIEEETQERTLGESIESADPKDRASRNGPGHPDTHQGSR